MKIVFYIAITVSTYLTMELITWLTHKYIMHGFLWFLHKDHHQPRYQHNFEKNDVFFVLGAIPSITLFYFGIRPAYNYLFFIALGVFFYGLTYFLIHDILIHQRFKLFTKTKNSYLKGLRKAHKRHHKHIEKEEGECFGLLNVPKKYFIKTKKN
tara:strand:- start:624 stop:1085 length:462 start_codon:yes stop_codon:yes gene_type:complete